MWRGEFLKAKSRNRWINEKAEDRRIVMKLKL